MGLETMWVWRTSGHAQGHATQTPPSLGNLQVSLCQQAWDVGCRGWKEPNALPLVVQKEWKDSGKIIGLSQRASHFHLTMQ